MLVTKTAAIPSGQSLSPVVDVEWPMHPIAVIIPAAWTAAVLTFSVSVDGSTYNNLYDDGGNEVTVQADVDRFITLPPALFAGFVDFKVRSGTSGSPVNQGAERSLTVVLRAY